MAEQLDVMWWHQVTKRVRPDQCWPKMWVQYGHSCQSFLAVAQPSNCSMNLSPTLSKAAWHRMLGPKSEDGKSMKIIQTCVGSNMSPCQCQNFQKTAVMSSPNMFFLRSTPSLVPVSPVLWCLRTRRAHLHDVYAPVYPCQAQHSPFMDQ